MKNSFDEIKEKKKKIYLLKLYSFLILIFYDDHYQFNIIWTTFIEKKTIQIFNLFFCLSVFISDRIFKEDYLCVYDVKKIYHHVLIHSFILFRFICLYLFLFFSVYITIIINFATYFQHNNPKRIHEKTPDIHTQHRHVYFHSC